MLAYIYVHTHTRSYRRESDDRHTPMPTLDLTCVQTHTHILGHFFCSASIKQTHKSTCVLEICLIMTHTLMPIPTLDCLHKHIFLLYVYRSVSLSRMRRYTQLAYLFHQCATNLHSRDGRIADCTVRHPGVERPFSS